MTERESEATHALTDRQLAALLDRAVIAQGVREEEGRAQL